MGGSALASTASSSAAAPAPTPASLAKAALRRLAQAQQEPTPENFARAYAEESGQPALPAADDAKAQSTAWATLCERLARNLDRGGKQWTAARRKDSLKRVFDGSRSDPQRLLQRLQSLLGAWEGDLVDDPSQDRANDTAGAPGAAANPHWPPLVATFEATVRAGLPAEETRAAEIAARLASLADAIARDGASPERVAEAADVCQQARRLFAHRHHLVEQLAGLCQELGAGLAEMAEDESWVRGQCDSLRAQLAEGPSARAVRAASTLLAETRQQQQQAKAQRQLARDALKQLLQDMLREVGELGDHTGRFQAATERHAEAIAAADSLEGLAGLVKTMLDDTRAVQSAVKVSQNKLQADHGRASELEARVRELEAEMRRLSDEVSTDALTQVANRRGLDQAFEAESARAERDGERAGHGLAVGLIDIDNFKKLNDSLGHAAGDTALKSLAAAVRERLRPVDHLARFGGEEFVVLLPGTEIVEAQQALTRLQRSLTEALFLHEGREVFVTFSAGVTCWRRGETLQAALERADEALYEAKRTGKNRTCIG